MVDYVRIPPDSTGKRLHSKAFTVDGSEVHQQKVQIGSPTSGTRTLEIDARGAAFTRFSEGEPAFDAYQSEIMSQLYMVGYYEFSNDSYADLYYTDEQNGGTVVYQSTASSLLFTTTGLINSKAEITTNRYHYYMPGFSNLIYLTVSCGDTGKTGNVRQWGYFNNENGVFFQLDENGLNIVKRNNVTGVPQDVVIPRSSWTDKLDGNGLSGITLDVTKAYTYWIDLAYPRGVTRFGIFAPDGSRVTAYSFPCPGAGSMGNLSKASLPIRVSNIDTGDAGNPSTIRFINAFIATEARDPQYTFWRFGGIASGERTVTENLPVLNVQSRRVLPSGVLNTINVFPEKLSCFVDSGAVRIDIVNHSEASNLLTGANWVEDAYSLESDNSATAIDSTSEDYWVFTSFYVGAGVTNIDLKTYYELNDEGILLAGDSWTRNIISFVCTPVSGSPKITMDLSVRELW